MWRDIFFIEGLRRFFTYRDEEGGGLARYYAAARHRAYSELVWTTIRVQSVCKNTVIPAKAGIQTKNVNSVFLAPRLREDDGKIELANGLGQRALTHHDNRIFPKNFENGNITLDIFLPTCYTYKGSKCNRNVHYINQSNCIGEN